MHLLVVHGYGDLQAVLNLTQAQFNGAIKAVTKHEKKHLSDLLFVARAAQADSKGYKKALKILES